MVHPKRRSNKIEILKSRLKSVTKLKLNKEQLTFNLRNSERSLSEELYATKAEIGVLTAQLEDLKDQVSEAAYQISRIEIYKITERSKIDSRIGDLDSHMKGYAEMFNRARALSELRNREYKEKHDEEQEFERQKQKQIVDKNELQAKEAAAVEQECDAIEQECTVLKKRNNAIMLKLRRKLVQTEDTRRDLMKKHDIPSN